MKRRILDATGVPWPTEVLTTVRGQDGMSLSFDAALCTACGQCLPTCPEAESGAITLSRRPVVSPVVLRLLLARCSSVLRHYSDRSMQAACR